jgi:hypothetical protein
VGASIVEAAFFWCPCNEAFFPPPVRGEASTGDAGGERGVNEFLIRCMENTAFTGFTAFRGFDCGNCQCGGGYAALPSCRSDRGKE